MLNRENNDQTRAHALASSGKLACALGAHMRYLSRSHARRSPHLACCLSSFLFLLHSLLALGGLVERCAHSMFSRALRAPFALNIFFMVAAIDRRTQRIKLNASWHR